MTAAVPARAYLSIGEVLAKLRPEFPDVTISKIRFLEAEGLVEPAAHLVGLPQVRPRRVQRLRYVLAAQRDRYLPLRGHQGPPRRDRPRPRAARASPGAGPRVPMALVADDGFPAAEAFSRDASELRLSRAELLEAAGLDRGAAGAARELRAGAARPGSAHYDGDALVVAKTVAEMAAFGLEARHLRAVQGRRRPRGRPRRAGRRAAAQPARPGGATRAPTRWSASWPRCPCGCTPHWSRPRWARWAGAEHVGTRRDPVPGRSRPGRPANGSLGWRACNSSTSSGSGSRCRRTSPSCCCARSRGSATCRSGSAPSRPPPSRSPSRAWSRPGR